MRLWSVATGAFYVLQGHDRGRGATEESGWVEKDGLPAGWQEDTRRISVVLVTPCYAPLAPALR